MKSILKYFVCILSVILPGYLYAESYYLIKVHTWSLEKLPFSAQDRIRKTIEQEKVTGPFHEDFSSKHGRELRTGADTIRTPVQCEEIRNKEDEDRKFLNIGSWTRDLIKRRVTVTYYPPFSAAKTVEAETVNGVAYIYLDGAYNARVSIDAPKGEFLSPVQGYVSVKAVELLNDREHVLSVHAIKE